MEGNQGNGLLGKLKSFFSGKNKTPAREAAEKGAEKKDEASGSSNSSTDSPKQ